MKKWKILSLILLSFLLVWCSSIGIKQRVDNTLSAKIYVANSGSNSISIIDVRTDKLIKTISVGERPIAMALSLDKLLLAVMNEASHSISLIDTQNDSLIKNLNLTPDILISHIKFIDTMRVVTFARGLRKRQTSQKLFRYQNVLFVLSFDLRNPDKIDTLTYLQNITKITNVLVSPAKKYLVITGYLDEISTDYAPSRMPVTLIDYKTKAVITNATLNVQNAVISPDEEYVYATTFMPSGFLKWTVNTHEGSFLKYNMLKSSGKMIVSSDGRYVYQLITGKPSIIEFDLVKGESNIIGLPYPSQNFTILDDQERLYCVHKTQNVCTVIDTKKKVIMSIINVQVNPLAIVKKIRR